MTIHVPSLLMGILTGFGIFGFGLMLSRAQGVRVIYRTRPWRRRSR